MVAPSTRKEAPGEFKFYIATSNRQWLVFVYTPNHPFSNYYPSVFLDGNDTVKLGDFGFSKALTQTSFASTYVGVRYCQGPIPAYTHLFLKGSILHVA